MRRDLSGETIGHYKLVRPIGEGVTGVVYLGMHKHMERPAAVKIVGSRSQLDERKIKRFNREARIHAKLDHKNIVPIWDYGFDEKCRVFYIVTKLIKGPSLAQVLHERRQLTLKESVQIILQMADALDYAHASGIYHLDLKPGNILIEAENSSNLYHKSAYLTDFGLSLQVEEAIEGSHLYIMYSCYWAPEQVLRNSLTTSESNLPLSFREDVSNPPDYSLDQCTDLYSLSVVFYEMLTGHLPFESKDPNEVARDIILTPPPPPSNFNPALPPSIDAFFCKGLAKVKTARFQTAREMMINLVSYI